MGIFRATEDELVSVILEIIDPLMPEGLDLFAREHVAKAIVESQKNPLASEGTYLLSQKEGNVTLEHADTCLVAAGLFSDRLARRVGDVYVDTVQGLAGSLYKLNAYLTVAPDSFMNLAKFTPSVVRGLQQSPLAVTSQTLEERYAHLLIGNSNYQA